MSSRTYEPAAPRRVAFLGLGVMGYPLAGHLVRAGHRVTVYNRSPGKATRWVAEYGAPSASTPRQAALEADFVCACVGNDDDLRSVVLGEDGAYAGMRAGSIFIDHTTASAAVARELSARGVECGVAFVDAPVSGGNVGATNGALTVMCGGEAGAFESARPIMANYARAVTRLGPSGAGQLTKMVNQTAIAGLLQGLAEAIVFGERAGLDMKAVLEVIGKGAAQSWQMDNRGPSMIEGRFDFGFAVDWMRKDLGLVLDEARRNGAQLPVTALVDQFYAELQAAGGNRADTSSLIQRLQRKR
jgi:3-hydroxyisobutyrate dehydrogenase-like beta-hydroxyacid dehydrogenase